MESLDKLLEWAGIRTKRETIDEVIDRYDNGVEVLARSPEILSRRTTGSYEHKYVYELRKYNIGGGVNYRIARIDKAQPISGKNEDYIWLPDSDMPPLTKEQAKYLYAQLQYDGFRDERIFERIRLRLHLAFRPREDYHRDPYISVL